jgi:uncharacterized membrane protein YfcA
VSQAGAQEKGPLWFLPVGAAIGMAGAMCGIGGGIFVGPLLNAVRRVPLQRAAATAILVVLPTTLFSTATEVLRADSQLHWPLVLPLAIGALIGAQLGFSASKRIDERGLKQLFALVLFLAGIRVLFFSGAPLVASSFGPGLASVLALVIGLAGGFLTPLLGVAGGILMVPALFLVLGQPFGVARASALAAGSVSALRSFWLHARARNIHFALGFPLAAGAALGAVAGVQAAHHPTLAQAGRMGLGILLVVQAAHVLMALRRAR